MKKAETAKEAEGEKNKAPEAGLPPEEGISADSDLSGPGAGKDLRYWRERILTVLLGSAVVIGIFAVVPSVWLAVNERLYFLALLDSAVYALALALFAGRRIPYSIRSLGALALLYVLGVGICLSVGFMSAGPFWLFTFAVLSGVLLGLKAAIVSLLLNLATLSVIGALIGSGALGADLAFFRNIPHALVVGANYIVLNSLIAVSISILLEGLQDTAERQKDTFRMLARERTELLAAKESLLEEVEQRKSTEAALRRSEERFREMADHLPETIYEMDLSGNLTFVNQSAYEQFGYSQADFDKGLSALETIAP